MIPARILFLDDSAERRKAASRALSCITVSTVTEFETALDSGPWATIYLDHDLGGESDTPIPNGPDGKTGMHAIDALTERPDRSPIVVVHTLNNPAAIAMVAKLKREGFTVVRRTFLDLLAKWKGET